MLSSLSTRCLALVAAVLVATTPVLARPSTTAVAIDFNCPGVVSGSVIRLKPCFKVNGAAVYLTACHIGICGVGKSEEVVFAGPSTGANEGFAQWRINLSTEFPGKVRLSNMGPGSTGSFLTASSLITAAGLQTRTAKSMSYADEPKLDVWDWGLRKSRTACRVLLGNQMENKRLGRPQPAWPKVNNLEVPVTYYGMGEEAGSNIFEVEVVNGYTAPAATAQAAAAAVARTQTAQVQAPVVQATQPPVQTTQPPAANANANANNNANANANNNGGFTNGAAVDAPVDFMSLLAGFKL